MKTKEKYGKLTFTYIHIQLKNVCALDLLEDNSLKSYDIAVI